MCEYGVIVTKIDSSAYTFQGASSSSNMHIDLSRYPYNAIHAKEAVRCNEVGDLVKKCVFDEEIPSKYQSWTHEAAI